METKPHRRTFWIVLLIISGLLLGCCAGLLIGGSAGYMLGRYRTGFYSGGSLYRSSPDRALPTPRVTPERQTPSRGGFLVTEVVPDGPAARAGLRPGDVIVALNSKPVDANNGVPDLLAGYKPGDKVEITVLRGLRQRAITVELGRNPNLPGDQSQNQAWLGVRLTAMRVQSQD